MSDITIVPRPLNDSERAELCAHIGAALELIQGRAPDWVRKKLLHAGTYAVCLDGVPRPARQIGGVLRDIADERRRFILSKMGVAA
jgi:hypothetical protein